MVQQEKMGMHLRRETRVGNGVRQERGEGREDLDEGYKEVHFTASQIS